MKRPTLSVPDKADICAGAVVFGLICCVVSIGLVSIMNAAVPMSVRLIMATVGVLTLLSGTWRLHRASTGRLPFHDETRRMLDDMVSLHQYRDGND